MGQQILIDLKVPDEYKVSHKIYEPVNTDRIVGIDTESIVRSGKLIFKYLQLYSPLLQHCYDLETSVENGLTILFDELMRVYGESYECESDIKQRSKLTRDERHKRRNNNGRDGRRQTIKPVILAHFNLDYDLGRIISEVDVFRRNIAYGSNSYTFEYGKYTIEIVYSCIGVACPSFQWFVREPLKKQVIRIVGFDSTSYFKSSLKKVCKALESMGVTQKLDIDGDMFTRDWDKEDETPSDDEIQHFLQYSLQDAKCHMELYNAIVSLLREIDECIIDKIGTIPASAPSAAARIMMHLCSVDKFKSPPIWVQQMGLDAYRGAISFCCKPGIHSSVGVVDISSAYPHVMKMLPDFCSVEYRKITPGQYIHRAFKGVWGVLVVSGESTDSLYPPLVSYEDGKQRGLYG